MRALACALLTLLALPACGDATGSPSQGGPTPPVSARPGIRAVAGADLRDTVRARASETLVVEVRRPDGSPAAGAIVRFEAMPPAEPLRRMEEAIHVCPLLDATCGPFDGSGYYPFDNVAIDTADGGGRAQALVRLGSVAGPAALVVWVPELGVRDTLRFTVLPGAAARVRVESRDTSLYPGARLRLQATVRDRFDNLRTETPSFRGIADATLTVDPQGDVQAASYGDARVIATFGSRADTVAISVVPRGRLVAWAPGEAGSPIVLVNLDGSDVKRLTGNPSGLGAFPTWSSRGDRVLFHTGDQVLTTIDTAGATRVPIGVMRSWFGQFTAGDREILYVGARPAIGVEAWRTDANGREASLLVPLHGFVNYPFGGAAFSRDGLRIAYTSDDGVRIVDLATGRAQLSSYGVAPSWSPSGDRIAFTISSDGAVAIVRADGTGREVVTTETFTPGLGWSPDGEWLVGRRSAGGRRLAVVRVRDRVAIPLYFSIDLYQPSWR